MDRFERLTNLVAALLATGRPLRLDEITERVPGYPPEGESRRRQFERDKETLRELGVPVATVAVDAFSGPAESAYRIEPTEYYLPDLGLAPDEVAALVAAVAAVRLEAGTAREAAWKLGGRPIDGEASPPLAALPVVEGLPRLFEAYRRRAVATFRYRDEERRLEPWAIVFRRGHWYAVGLDRLRAARRSFRVDRIVGEVAVGPAGAFERPEGFDPGEVLADEPWRLGDDAAVEALVLIDAEQAPWVRAAARRRGRSRGGRPRARRGGPPRALGRDEPRRLPVLRARPARPRRGPRPAGAACRDHRLARRHRGRVPDGRPVSGCAGRAEHAERGPRAGRSGER